MRGWCGNRPRTRLTTRLMQDGMATTSRRVSERESNTRPSVAVPSGVLCDEEQASLRPLSRATGWPAAGTWVATTVASEHGNPLRWRGDPVGWSVKRVLFFGTLSQEGKQSQLRQVLKQKRRGVGNHQHPLRTHWRPTKSPSVVQGVMFLGRNPGLIVESVVPDFLPVIPVRSNNRAQWDTSMPRHRAYSAPRSPTTLYMPIMMPASRVSAQRQARHKLASCSQLAETGEWSIALLNAISRQGQT